MQYQQCLQMENMKLTEFARNSIDKQYMTMVLFIRTIFINIIREDYSIWQNYREKIYHLAK